MESPVLEWTKPTGARIGWMLLGVLLTLLASWCYRQYGKEVAFRMYVRALAEKPKDINDVERVFAGSKKTIIYTSEDFSYFRCRFAGGGEIDVVLGADRRVVSIEPTFARDGLGLLWLLHRRQFITVPVKIPLRERSETLGPAEPAPPQDDTSEEGK